MHRSLWLAPLVIGWLLATVGCDKLPFGNKPTPRKAAAPAPSTSAPAAASARGPASRDAGPERTDKFALPFAYERADDEPLARARGFMNDLFRDNIEYMKSGPRFFQAFAKSQRPRATVLTCSDSRVQTRAWDATPENDDFVVRNIGNQLSTSLGSVEYGVSDLGTPVLLILGHTGCGAVKAALSPEQGHHGPSVGAEIATLTLPEHLHGRDSETSWTDAVIANVHNQVKAALVRFSPLIAEGRLTVIGAVYDFRNDLRRGAGRVILVDVNGNAEPKRLSAFTTAVYGSAILDEPTVEPEGVGGRSRVEPAGPQNAADAEAADLAAIAEAVRKLPGLAASANPR